MLQILELSDKDFKIAIIKILQWATTNTFETNEKLVSEKKAENGSFRTEKYNKLKIEQ